MNTSANIVVFFVLTVLVSVNEASNTANFALFANSISPYKYACDAGHITINAQEFVEINLQHDRYINAASCKLNKHEEKLVQNETDATIMNIQVKTEAYMSGKWICTAFHNREMNQTDANNIYPKTTVEILKQCKFNVTVIDQWQKNLWMYVALGAGGFIIIIIAQFAAILFLYNRQKDLWMYVALGAGGFIIIIIAQFAAILFLYNRQKGRKANRLDELSLNQNQIDNVVQDAGRYGAGPSLKDLLPKNKKCKADVDAGSIYETLDAVAIGSNTPPLPSVNTIPRKPKKSVTSTTSKRSVPKEEILPTTLPRKDLLEDEKNTLEHMKGRPRMPSPKRTPEEKSGSMNKFIASFNHKTPNPEPVAPKNSNHTLPAMNKRSQANTIRPENPEPKAPTPKLIAALGSKTPPHSKPPVMAKPPFTRTVPSSTPKQTKPTTQQMKQQPLRATVPATSIPQQSIPERSNSTSKAPPQSSSLFPRKTPRPTPQTSGYPPTQHQRMQPDVVIQTKPSCPLPIIVKSAEHLSEPVYEEYNSDEEWTYEQLDKYNIYSN